MAELSARLRGLRQRWDSLPLSSRLSAVTVLLLVAGLGTWFFTADHSPSKTVLFSGLADDDAARIVERLRAANIPYALGDGGATVLVPEEQVHETRLLLAGEGLPSGGGVGFEVFDEQRFGESEFSEQVKYHRALEGELSRTIAHLSGVKAARVHLVLPSRGLFAGSEPSASASVVIHPSPGFRLRDDQVKGILHLVASSVRGLSPERVTLVDGGGRRLAGGGGGGAEAQGELASDAESYRRAIERGKEQAAQQLLDTTLGAGKSLVRVAAQVSFTREETTEERYDPQGVAPRSFQISEERDGARDRAVQGVPGTPSNLPGGTAVEPAPAAGGGTTRRSETRNFEVSKVLRRAVEPVGRVTGLQVAVVVDGSWKGAGDKRKFEPLPKAELDRLQTVVASAIGLDAARGDKVVVECVPFAALPEVEDDGSTIDRAADASRRYLPLALLLGGALFALLFFRKLMRLLRAAPPGSGAPLLGAPLLTALPVTDKAAQSVLFAGQDVHSLPDRAHAAPGARDDTLEQVRVLASEMASHEPEAAARVIRGWLGDGS